MLVMTWFWIFSFHESLTSSLFLAYTFELYYTLKYELCISIKNHDEPEPLSNILALHSEQSILSYDVLHYINGSRSTEIQLVFFIVHLGGIKVAIFLVLKVS